MYVFKFLPQYCVYFLPVFSLLPCHSQDLSLPSLSVTYLHSALSVFGLSFCHVLNPYPFLCSVFPSISTWPCPTPPTHSPASAPTHQGHYISGQPTHTLSECCWSCGLWSYQSLKFVPSLPVVLLCTCLSLDISSVPLWALCMKFVRLSRPELSQPLFTLFASLLVW